MTGGKYFIGNVLSYRDRDNNREDYCHGHDNGHGKQRSRYAAVRYATVILTRDSL